MAPRTISRLQASYCDPDPANEYGFAKIPFLSDARALMRQIGQHLAGRGLTQLDIHINEGGPAVSGDVYGRFAFSDDELVDVEIGACAVGGDRLDHVTIVARTCRYTLVKKGQKLNVKLGQFTGPNVWLNANSDAARLAARIVDVARKQGYQLASIVANAQPDPDAQHVYGLDPDLCDLRCEPAPPVGAMRIPQQPRRASNPPPARVPPPATGVIQLSLGL